MRPACRCGHPADAHDHYRRGSDCSHAGCGCGRYRREFPILGPKARTQQLREEIARKNAELDEWARFMRNLRHLMPWAVKVRPQWARIPQPRRATPPGVQARPKRGRTPQ